MVVHEDVNDIQATKSFSDFHGQNRQWRYITAGSPKSSSDGAGIDVQFYSSAKSVISSYFYTIFGLFFEVK